MGHLCHAGSEVAGEVQDVRFVLGDHCSRLEHGIGLPDLEEALASTTAYGDDEGRESRSVAEARAAPKS